MNRESTGPPRSHELQTLQIKNTRKSPLLTEYLDHRVETDDLFEVGRVFSSFLIDEASPFMAHCESKP